MFGAEISFEHPQLFRAKGEVLSRARGYGVQGWELTNSCVHEEPGLDSVSRPAGCAQAAFCGGGC